MCPERLALRWVRKYISAFGGDPKKVTMCAQTFFHPFLPSLHTSRPRRDFRTLESQTNFSYAHSWGQSAGAISVSLQMIMNGGDNEGLFRGGIMQSGGPIPVGDIEHGQIYYDDVVKKTGCEDATDTLDCLRRVPYSKLKGAIDESPDIFAFQVCMFMMKLWHVSGGYVLMNFRLWMILGISTGVASEGRWTRLGGAASALGLARQSSRCTLYHRHVMLLLDCSFCVTNYFAFQGNCDDEGEEDTLYCSRDLLY